MLENALCFTFLNDDSSPKHSWFSFVSQALASGCRKSRQNYFQTEGFLFSKDPRIWHCIKSQLVTNKEYILNGYLYRFFWNHKKQDIFRKVPFRSKVSIKTWQLFLLSFDSRVGAKNCFQETLASGASWNNYLPQTKNVS